MTSVTTDQARQRFLTIPEDIQDMIFSVQTAAVIQKICEDNHVPREKWGGVAEAAGLVLLGFIHPEDLANEIKERLMISSDAAGGLASSLINKMFASMKSRLDSLYHPLTGPQVTEIRPPQPVKYVPQAAAPPAPSKQTTGIEAPVRPISISQLLKEKEFAASTPTLAPPQNELKQPPSTPQAPAPVFLFRQEEIQPLETKGRINIPIPKPTIMPGPAPKPAEVEIGGLPKTEAPRQQPARSDASPTRVIHYSQFSSPLEKTAPGGPASISDLGKIPMPTRPVPEIPKPSSPFAPPRPPESGRGSPPLEAAPKPAMPTPPPIAKGPVLDLKNIPVPPPPPSAKPLTPPQNSFPPLPRQNHVQDVSRPVAPSASIPENIDPLLKKPISELRSSIAPPPRPPEDGRGSPPLGAAPNPNGNTNLNSL